MHAFEEAGFFPRLTWQLNEWLMFISLQKWTYKTESKINIQQKSWHDMRQSEYFGCSWDYGGGYQGWRHRGRAWTGGSWCGWDQRLTSLKLEIEEVMFKVVSGDAKKTDVRVLMGAGLKLKRQKKKEALVLSLYVCCIMTLQGQTEG